jgi:ATP-dependent RNA helicase DDX6/DHH1
LPEKRQIMLMSATFPVLVKEFKDKYMQGCSVINLMEELTLKGVTQYYVYIEEKQKVKLLKNLFSKVKKKKKIYSTKIIYQIKSFKNKKKKYFFYNLILNS